MYRAEALPQGIRPGCTHDDEFFVRLQLIPMQTDILQKDGVSIIAWKTRAKDKSARHFSKELLKYPILSASADELLDVQWLPTC